MLRLSVTRERGRGAESVIEGDGTVLEILSLLLFMIYGVYEFTEPDLAFDEFVELVASMAMDASVKNVLNEMATNEHENRSASDDEAED